jgi:hypothetical protein
MAKTFWCLASDISMNHSQKFFATNMGVFIFVRMTVNSLPRNGPSSFHPSGLGQLAPGNTSTSRFLPQSFFHYYFFFVHSQWSGFHMSYYSRHAWWRIFPMKKVFNFFLSLISYLAAAKQHQISDRIPAFYCISISSKTSTKKPYWFFWFIYSPFNSPTQILLAKCVL